MRKLDSSVSRVGSVFGRLTILEAGRQPSGKFGWVCQCQCGSITGAIQTSHLTSGDTKSCGCWAKDHPSHLEHGATGSPEWRTWWSMWERCTNPNATGYQKYKDRAPPEVWRDFAVFYAELGPKPSPKHTLDRIKNELPYGPGNCQWATRKEQAQNTKANFLVEFGGETLCFTEACRRAGLRESTVRRSWVRTKDMQVASKGLIKVIPGLLKTDPA